MISFTVLTEIATLIHLGKFHFQEPLVWAGLAAWIWLGIYTLVPIALIALLPGQLRVRGEDPPRTAPLPRAVAVVLGVEAFVLLLYGGLLFLDPVRWTSIWPWPLTPLTGRAVAAWLLGIAIGLVAAIAEGDLLRIRPGLVAFALFGTLQPLALARYGGDVAWSEPQAWIYVGVVASMAVLGWLGVAASFRASSTKAHVA